MSSVSSAPLLELTDELNPHATEDGLGAAVDPGIAGSSSTGSTQAREIEDALVDRYSEGHEGESIYSCAWSATDAWVFASLSYDGSVVAHRVPSTEKYKILL